MYTINEEYKVTQIINKSTFICYLFPVETPEEAMEKINQIRKIHYDATHNCYAMITGTDIISARSSDDGEPSKTAGIPIYEVLNKNNLTNILAIVTRYFGGVKLGAGGLIRAYSGSCALALKEAKLIKIEKKITIQLSFSYTYVNEINKLFSGQIEISKDYGTFVTYTYSILEEDLDKFSKEVTSLTNGQSEVKVIG